MTKKYCQEMSSASGEDRESKSGSYKKRMPTIKCVCGYEILVVPDLKAMDRAIKNHIAEHKQVDYGLALDSLEETLTHKVLMAVSKMNLPNAS